ncbi:MAG: hypothetical protein PGN16_00045 [Sphingomonas phyllosphaerae]|uniref:hypothetical protein n=1 Tax=Sphingomonas phyllosphaerae TaxID=257003 RepID=UPI002FFBD2EF
MATDSGLTPGIGHNQPCALCAGGGPGDEVLVEQVADDLWESRRHGTLDDVPWAECGAYWQHIFRGFAAAAIASIKKRTATLG